MWPARAFCAAHNAFWEFSNNNIYVAKWLEKRCCKIIESKLMITSVVFILAVPQQTTFHSPAIFWEYANDVFTCSIKHTAGFLVKSFGECCLSTVLTAACYWPESHCIPAQMFVSMSVESNHDHSSLVLDSDKSVCCHRSFSKFPSVVLNLFAEGSQIQTTILLESDTKCF